MIISLQNSVIEEGGMFHGEVYKTFVHYKHDVPCLTPIRQSQAVYIGNIISGRIIGIYQH